MRRPRRFSAKERQPQIIGSTDGNSQGSRAYHHLYSRNVTDTEWQRTLGGTQRSAKESVTPQISSRKSSFDTAANVPLRSDSPGESRTHSPALAQIGKPRLRLFTKMTDALSEALNPAKSPEHCSSSSTSDFYAGPLTSGLDQIKNSSSSMDLRQDRRRHSSSFETDTGEDTGTDSQKPLSKQESLKTFLRKRRAQNPEKYPPPRQMSPPPADKTSKEYKAWLRGPIPPRPRFCTDEEYEEDQNVVMVNNYLASERQGDIFEHDERPHFPRFKTDEQGVQYVFCNKVVNGRAVYTEALDGKGGRWLGPRKRTVRVSSEENEMGAADSDDDEIPPELMPAPYEWPLKPKSGTSGEDEVLPNLTRRPHEHFLKSEFGGSYGRKDSSEDSPLTSLASESDVGESWVLRG